MPTTAALSSDLAREPARDGWAAGVLALAVFLAPALGVPTEEMLQDTLKSMIVSFGALAAALLFLLAQRERRQPLRWHGVLWLPLLLLAHALGSMIWSHTYLAGVEAVRWFVFALIAWLGLNTFSRERLPMLAWAIHAGALVATIWAMAQFWGGLELFPQGPRPSSTFINRNFYAEYVVCALPFGALLLARARASALAFLLAVSLGLLATGILITGTRSALIASTLLVLAVFPLVAWRCRARLAFSRWSRGLQAGVLAVIATTVLLLGVLPTSNTAIIQENFGTTPIERGLHRAQQIGPNDYSLNLRMVMWKATLTAIAARPLAGLGAGAWENEIPRYQAEGSQLETDYYVHNEFLQLVAEYGLVGWIFLLLLSAWLLAAAWRTWAPAGPQAEADQPWRATLLASLFALMLVSSIGFPWRLAATGALFAACLGALAASDARMGHLRRWSAQPLRWSPRIAHVALGLAGVGLVLAFSISQRAAESEQKLVRSAKLALSLTATGNPNAPQYAPQRREVLRLVREGIALNPHYRKITPMVADELARWGDWKDATWIWESVLSSRPNVVAILTNVARGYASMGRIDRAQAWLEQAKRLQPRAPSVRSLEVILAARGGDEPRALALAKAAYDEGISDYDLLNTYFLLAWRAKDYALAQKLLDERMQAWPDSRARGLVEQGVLALEQKQQDRALQSFRAGLAAAATPQERAALEQEIPPALRAQVSAPGSQTSSSSR
ncbi:MAG TPA: O-antigen ligase family protein [Ramlibacter sp.]|uniref:O-antigen ligase family protein n=1 Tax=Ramlibacter sp. TaxID=1917967 RepID=UPI002D7F97A0|nr:O-antigen ligase family protein [Ramlibacter sp.]HET8747065.1 O-antigen ligase family protein [Ramlibacter sp.]